MIILNTYKEIIRRNKEHFLIKIVAYTVVAAVVSFLFLFSRITKIEVLSDEERLLYCSLPFLASIMISLVLFFDLQHKKFRNALLIDIVKIKAFQNSELKPVLQWTNLHGISANRLEAFFLYQDYKIMLSHEQDENSNGDVILDAKYKPVKYIPYWLPAPVVSPVRIPYDEWLKIDYTRIVDSLANIAKSLQNAETFTGKQA